MSYLSLCTALGLTGSEVSYEGHARAGSRGKLRKGGTLEAVYVCGKSHMISLTCRIQSKLVDINSSVVVAARGKGMGVNKA